MYHTVTKVTIPLAAPLQDSDSEQLGYLKHHIRPSLVWPLQPGRAVPVAEEAASGPCCNPRRQMGYEMQSDDW